MKNLNCTTSNCEHNLKGICMAGVITIDENAKCLSKVKREGGALAQAFADVEAAEELDVHSTSDCVVQCNAECVFNENNICTSREITVADKIMSTKCKSRQKNKI